jgi:hypothetical protein
MNILHNEEVFVRSVEELVYAHDVRVIELGLDIRLPAESRSQILRRFGGERNGPDAFHDHIARQ